MIRLNCQCGKGVKLPAQHVGQALACPHCKTPVRVIASVAASQPERVDSLFVIQSGPDRKGEQIFLGGGQAIKIGKSEQAEFRLRSPSVSRVHCLLVPGQYGWRIEDDNSTNGLFVNGRRVKGHNLLNGDVVRVGEFELRYISEQAAAKRASSPGATAVTGSAASDGGLEFLDDSSVSQGTVAMPPPIPVPVGSRQTPPPPPPPKSPAVQADDEPLRFADDEWEGVVPTPKRESGKTCPRCGTPLPPEARLCINCGTDLRSGKAIHIQTGGESAGPSPRLGPYIKDCLSSFVFIAEPGGAITFVFLSVLAVLQVPLINAPFMGPYITCFLLFILFTLRGLLCAYMFSVVVSAANGEEDLPKFSISGGLIDDAIVPLLKYLGTWLMALLPAIVWAFWLAGVTWASLLQGGGPNPLPFIVFVALLAVGVFCWPFTVLAVAVGGYSTFLRPDLIVYTILRTFIPYLFAFAATALAFALTYVVEFLLAAQANKSGNFLVAEAIGWVFAVYFWIVAMRVIGLYYHHFKRLFAWSWG